MSTAAQRCFAITAPGLEGITAAELAALGIVPLATEPGGVEFEATPIQLQAANLELRTAGRILVRLAEFPARAFYELERKARRVPWTDIVGPTTPVRFRVTARKSRLYHADAIAQRLLAVLGGERATEARGNPGDDDEEAPDRAGTETQLFVVRVLRDIVTVSAD
ncbi:MAG TPA: THUMP domain-containing protein, partial [Gemmatimonadales bacterium]|nr:THUMP domain-containing protein [Gemmatimonadales bacterium]